MSVLDIYDDTENLISSDEYSEEDDDDLMNAAISSQHTSKSDHIDVSSKRDDLYQANKKLKELKLLQRNKKLSSIYKKRSIKLLNSKQKREKCREYLQALVKKKKETVAVPTMLERRDQNAKMLLMERKNVDPETISLDDTDFEVSPVKNEPAGELSAIHPRSVQINNLLAKEVPPTEVPIMELLTRELPVTELLVREEPAKELASIELPIKNLSHEEIVMDIAAEEEEEEKMQVRAASQPRHITPQQKAVTPPPQREKVGQEKANLEQPLKASEIIIQQALPQNSNKRARSPTPENAEQTSNVSSKRHEPERRNSSSIYKEINELFPKHDKVIGQHIKASNSTVDAIEESMTRILQDIQTLNEIIQTKEVEWNRLVHLKQVKEEILTRLARKRHIAELQEKQTDNQKYNLLELKELEAYLSQSHTTASSSHHAYSTAQQLIESRANMKRADLEKERTNTNRLQSILISNNILPKIDREQSAHFDDGKDDDNSAKSYLSASAKNQELLQSYQYLENKVKSSNIGRQGPFKDVKSIIADFRQKNPEILPRVGKRIKLNESFSPNVRNLNKLACLTQSMDTNHLSIEPSFDIGGNYTPTLEKLLSSSARNNSDSLQLKNAPSPYSQGFKFNNGGAKNFYRLHGGNDEVCNEISITPVSNENRYLHKNREYKAAELLRSALHTNSQPKRMYVDASEYGGNNKNYKHVEDLDSEMQTCQKCKIHEARFVCAGCGNQWYCSRSCQISAWDKHSESCNE